MARCQVHSRSGGKREQSQRRDDRHRLLWSENYFRLALLCALTVLLLATPSAGKGTGGVTVEKIGKSAAGLSALSPLKILRKGIPRAISLALLEQELEDLNVMHKFDRRTERLAMVMPLTHLCDPGIENFAHEHIQEGDKVSLPWSLFSELVRSRVEVPWQFKLQLVQRKGPGKFEPVDVPIPTREELYGKKEMPQLSSLPCGILDARSPEHFIFIPNWMMKALRLKPRDIVRYRCKRLTRASKIVLQPHSSAFLKMSNRQAVLETELRHYSTISRGTTIAFRYRRELYEFNVLECIDIDGTSQEAVCLQDADVVTDFQAALDTPAGRQRPNPRARNDATTVEQHSGDAGLSDDLDESKEREEDEAGWGDDEL